MQDEIAVFLLENHHIKAVQVCDANIANLLCFDATHCPGRKLTDIFPGINVNIDKGTIRHKGKVLNYAFWGRHQAEKGVVITLRNSLMDDVMQFAMDLIEIGVQVYSADADLLLVNNASERISNIDREEALGKHLMDIYDTDETQSTVLSAIRSRAPIYKCAGFDVRNGIYTSVINTTVPYLDADGTLAAVVNLEYNDESLGQMTRSIHELQKKAVPSAVSINEQGRYFAFDDIVGEDPAFLDAMELARKASLQNSSIFISGETGTGKELVVQSIYSYAASKYKSFVAINCSTIPDGLADATLFGSIRGAFTGSVDAKGLFAEADGGILFLDEINSLASATQARLLRVLQEGTYMKVGSTKEVSCDVRIIAACNQNPWELVRQGKFRQDLFYRLTTTMIDLPPLRERRSDIVLLLNYFLRHYSNKLLKNVSFISKELLYLCNRYDWPGNIRELKNVVEFAVNMATGPEIGVAHVPKYLKNKINLVKRDYNSTIEIEIDEENGLNRHIEQYEAHIIRSFLQKYNNNISRTASALKINRQTLQYKLKKYNILERGLDADSPGE